MLYGSSRSMARGKKIESRRFCQHRPKAFLKFKTDDPLLASSKISSADVILNLVRIFYHLQAKVTKVTASLFKLSFFNRFKLSYEKFLK